MYEGDHSEEAEAALLGAVLIDNEAWDQVADLWRPEVFWHDGHRAVADAMMELRRAGSPIDSVGVLTVARAKGQVPDPVPQELPFTLASGLGTAANARFYAETLRSMWISREVKRAARECATTSGLSGEELAAKFGARLSALESSKARPARLLGEAIVQRLDAIEAQALGKAAVARIPTGFDRIDRLLGGLGVGHLTVVGARPGAGKTAFISALADNVSANTGPVFIFQLEDYIDGLADRAIARRAKINSTMLQDGTRWTREHWDRVGTSVNPTIDLPIYVDEQHGLTPADVAARMRSAKRKHGVRLFVVDNLSELVVDGRAERHDRELGRAARALRDVAYSLDAALVLLVHLNREIERRADPTPKLSDLKNSGDLEDAAHVVAFVSRPEDAPGVFVFDVAKNRTGPRGRIVLSWLEDYMAVANPRG